MFDFKEKFDSALILMTWAAAAAVAAFFFFCVALFVWTREQYGTVTASLVLAIVFTLVAIAALIALVLTRRHAVAQQRQQPSPQWWSDPMVMTTALEALRLAGGKRVLTMLLGGLVLGTLLTRPNERKDVADRKP